jgi:hypothetical protein
MKAIGILLLFIFPLLVSAGEADKLRDAMNKPLIVVAENPYQENYKIAGVEDYSSFFKNVFNKIWPNAKDIHYISYDSLTSLVKN